MSNWSHVAAVVRVDSIEGGMDFEKIFGKEVLFYSPGELWDEADKYPERFLPMGSEGSLRMTVWENPNRSHLAKYTVSIFGDLRDDDNPKHIIEWFREKCSDDELWVRNAVIVVDNEIYGVSTWWSGGD